MTPELWHRVRTTFHGCLELEGTVRSAFLDRECDGDPTLRSEVESLLESAARSDTFMERPAAGTHARHAPDEWLGKRLGAYEVVSLLAIGGMGEVYHAVRADDQYRQQVAIKLVRQGLEGSATIARFKAERQILASLDHPNIARLLDAGIAATGQPYFVMQFVEGEPIDRYCESHGLSLADRIRLFCEVCKAVQYAHQHLTVHRDLKPANILVTRDGEPKLLDFGIAKVIAPDADPVTVSSMWAMTPDYASPEQVRGQPITTASDVYSLGVILYRLLTGKSPYRATQTQPLTLAQEVCETQPTRPSTRFGAHEPSSKQLQGDLDSIVLMALRKEPERRYASVHDFSMDLRHHLEGRPVSAAPDSWHYRTGKFVKRHRFGVVVSVAAGIALLTTIGVIIKEGEISRAARQRAESRFNDVRQIANALIFELDDAVAKLEGSTPTRRLLVEKAVRYLDMLSQEAKDDVVLQRDMGNAFQKLGDIQGNPVLSNLGLTAEARESYGKAIDIRQALVAAEPGNIQDRLALAASYAGLADFLISTSGDLDSSLQYANRALAIVEPLQQGDPRNPQFAQELIGVYQTLSSIYGGSGSSANLGDVDAAVVNSRKAIVISDRVFQIRSDWQVGQRAELSIGLGDKLVKQGNRIEAVDEYRDGLELLRHASLGSSNAEFARLSALIFERLGNVQAMDGDFASATKSYGQSHVIYERTSAKNPEDVQAKFDLAAIDALYGNALVRQGDRRGGMRFLDAAATALERDQRIGDESAFARRLLSLTYVLRGQLGFAAADYPAAATDFAKAAALLPVGGNADLQAQMSWAAIQVKLADVHAKQGDVVRARVSYGQALQILEPLTGSRGPQIEALYATADAYTGLGATLLAGDNARSRSKAKLRCREARPWLERSVATWRLIRNPGRFNPSGFATAGPKEAARLLSLCLETSEPSA
jgi:non-specific serine/threonine protein kinase/serine/threonine-protein kinase